MPDWFTDLSLKNPTRPQVIEVMGCFNGVASNVSKKPGQRDRTVKHLIAALQANGERERGTLLGSFLAHHEINFLESDNGAFRLDVQGTDSPKLARERSHLHLAYDEPWWALMLPAL
ncbi:hypothetical protein SAPIO_CDS7795 [Scedosporium apiospermum]|uniref:Uncharacterized protein n=1 Tax=Pseudallescheria apiosperma TaxID=563466 RepID=A0A084G2Q2_PSEDA|nr:uncharacterized protein SAPIO_CDS7795 [Scedosporium apiospermum]KEZ41614.1 hypothetical protein SAPIO_CDS7795 [Scedosporium apiospermum]